MLDEVQSCFAEIASAIADSQTLIVVAPDTTDARRALSGHPHAERILYLECPTNDTWARDFGAICLSTVEGWEITDFKFNGWGLKFAADRDNLITRRMVEAGLLRGRYVNRLGFVLEGGSIESDGQGTLLTTSECLLSPNRNGDLSREEIEARLKEYFGLDRVLWLDNGALEGDDTDSHIDTLARLAPDDTIIYVGCNDETDAHYASLAAMKHELMELRTASGMPYNLVELPMADAIYDEEGNRLPATYANFLIMNDTILMPFYGQPRNDDLAAKNMRIAFPNHTVKGIDCRALIRQHGSLHCVTMQLPADVLPL
jgi:agmatine/peptidylarginine deiminase